jgi:hypothetical protein
MYYSDIYALESNLVYTTVFPTKIVYLVLISSKSCPSTPPFHPHLTDNNALIWAYSMSRKYLNVRQHLREYFMQTRNES